MGRKGKGWTLTRLVFSVMLTHSSAKVVKISNVKQRHDTSNVLMDAHDGNVVQYEAGGLYYM